MIHHHRSGSDVAADADAGGRAIPHPGGFQLLIGFIAEFQRHLVPHISSHPYRIVGSEEVEDAIDHVGLRPPIAVDLFRRTHVPRFQQVEEGLGILRASFPEGDPFHQPRNGTGYHGEGVRLSRGAVEEHFGHRIPLVLAQARQHLQATLGFHWAHSAIPVLNAVQHAQGIGMGREIGQDRPQFVLRAMHPQQHHVFDGGKFFQGLVGFAHESSTPIG